MVQTTDRRKQMNATTRPGFVAIVVTLLLAGCGSDDANNDSTETVSTSVTAASQPAADTTAASDELAQPVIDPGDAGDYAPEINPADFSDVVDNPFRPLLPGARWVYEARTGDGEVEKIVVEVLDERRTVMGVSTIVVHDVVSIGGEVIEDTYDWFAQDSAGNVWYFGEDTTAYDDAGAASHEGAWEAGVNGALPGIVMLAEPAVTGVGYRQEYLPGEAEDMGQVIAVSGSASTPFGDFDDVIQTRDWTPLEPDVVEQKTYARGVGFVVETKNDGEIVELVEHAPDN
jgi:hypothetical protein